MAARFARMGEQVESLVREAIEDAFSEPPLPPVYVAIDCPSGCRCVRWDQIVHDDVLMTDDWIDDPFDIL